MFVLRSCVMSRCQNITTVDQIETAGNKRLSCAFKYNRGVVRRLLAVFYQFVVVLFLLLVVLLCFCQFLLLILSHFIVKLLLVVDLCLFLVVLFCVSVH